MSKAIEKFNGLNGIVATREQLEQIAELSLQEEQVHVYDRIQNVLSNNEDELFDINIEENAFEIAPKSMLNGLHFEENTDEENTGLNKAVSSTEIYQMITDKMLAMIKEASGKGYVKKWKGNVYGKGYTIPFNFDSKKRYRGVNVFLLTGFEPLENPFFMTFKQIEAHKGTLKKGSKGSPVVYFTNLYKITDKNRNIDFGTYDLKKAKDFADKNGFSHADIKTLPILKYYNVFNGKDIDGIDFDLENFKIGYIENELPTTETMPIPEAIVKNYPAPAPIIKHGGDKAYHQGGGVGLVQMPHMADFETAQDYYRTLFHELAHSTGSPDRLNRKLGNKFGSKDYAFEELIAEWGATFLSAEAGIIFHTNNNHAEYIKNWNGVLTHVKDDNKFIMRACTKAQELTDFILQFDDNGTPKYMETLEVEAPKIEVKKPVAKKVKKAITVETLLTDFVILCKEEMFDFEFKKTTKKFKAGDSYSSDFDYKGMLQAGTKVTQNDSLDYLEKLHSSFQDVNFHDASKPLWEVILLLRKDTKTPKTEIKNDVSVKKDYPFSKDDIPFETARRAYYWTSMTPEKRAEMEQKNYFETMQEIYDKFLLESKTKDLEEKFLALFDKFNKGYLKLKLAELSARSNTASTMITGGSNFNVSKNQKALNRHKSKQDELYSFSDKYQKYFKDLLFPEEKPIKSGKSDTLERLEEKLNKLEDNQVKMVNANAEIRKLKKKGLSNSELIAEYEKYLASVGFSSKEIESTVNLAKRENNLMWLPFGTTNSSAEIRRVKQRIELEKKLKTKAETIGTEEKFYFDNGYIFNDYSDNRVKINFEGKPAEEIRSFLKKSGQNFKWSPFNKVWQRQLNTYYKGSREELYNFLGINKNTDNNQQKKNEVKPIEQPVKVDSNGQASLFGVKKVTPNSAPKKHAKISKIALAGNDQESEFYTVAGEVGKFLQQVERKPVESVVVTLDGQQGAGKTTTLYKFMDSFAVTGNKCLFLSLEEHPASSLAKDKVSKYLSIEAQENIDTVGEVESISELYDFIKDYEIIFIDSWQKLQRMVGAIRLDEDLRKKFNGKVFVVIFQQTTTGRTKGGAEVVFDGDIIIKMVKESSFADNYAYFDKNRYTLIAIEDIRFNIASGTCYNPNAKEEKEPATELQPVEEVEFNFVVK